MLWPPNIQKHWCFAAIYSSLKFPFSWTLPISLFIEGKQENVFVARLAWYSDSKIWHCIKAILSKDTRLLICYSFNTFFIYMQLIRDAKIKLGGMSRQIKKLKSFENRWGVNNTSKTMCVFGRKTEEKEDCILPSRFVFVTASISVYSLLIFRLLMSIDGT